MSEQQDRLPRIAVVGSINMDLLINCQRLPQAGETVSADSLVESPGGKGANQAVAAARLGSQVAMIGRVGNDLFGSRLLENLEQEKVDLTYTLVSEGFNSGTAIVQVETSGENAITILAGANAQLTPADIRVAADCIESADTLLVQLEIPLETALAAITLARKCGTRVVLDPAPAPEQFPHGLLDVDVICPNIFEAELLTQLPVGTPEQMLAAAAKLRELGARSVVITLGRDGALVYQNNGQHEFIRSVEVQAVDTTGAGDAFAAGLGARLSQGDSLLDATHYACLAGAASAQCEGAQLAMPTHADVLKLSRKSITKRVPS